ncbi:MAG: deoxyribodipyrimidine photo-lyase [Proteobacteria bacterium]|nr:deoxyribodipyrimidine photo-lyase [Pseudomonadota bacterium]
MTDHAPLAAALDAGGDLICLFVLDPHFFAPARARGLPHRVQFLLESLRSLEANLTRLGSKLFIVPGRSVEVVPRLATLWKADRVLASRWSEPVGVARDLRIAGALGRQGVPFELHEGETLAPPGTVRTGDGRLHAVFTPFARAFEQRVLVETPLPAPKRLPPPPTDLARVETVPAPSLESLGLRRNPEVLEGGERAARARLKRFVDEALGGYSISRDRLDQDGTSRLSQDLKFGTLSIRTVWNAVRGHGEAARRFRGELLWREFAYHWLRERPDLLEKPFRSEFEAFPWSRDEALFAAWKEGRTGYPAVDAAARQLRETGFVHNRARMIAASFLAKHLALDFRMGEAHYLAWLTDGDWAINDLGWQWSAGCGCDAQPWFRVFNPILQGQKFDPDGAYVKRFVPELASLDARWIHEPWKAGRRLDYPAPIVDHAAARARFLQLAKAHLKAPA